MDVIKQKQQWSEEETSCFLALWFSLEVQSKLVGASRTNPVLQQIQREMAVAGFDRILDQISNKLKKLKKDYMCCFAQLVMGKNDTFSTDFSWQPCISTTMAAEKLLEPVMVRRVMRSVTQGSAYGWVVRPVKEKPSYVYASALMESLREEYSRSPQALRERSTVLSSTTPAPLSRSLQKINKDEAVGVYLSQHSRFNTLITS